MAKLDLQALRAAAAENMQPHPKAKAEAPPAKPEMVKQTPNDHDGDEKPPSFATKGSTEDFKKKAQAYLAERQTA